MAFAGKIHLFIPRWTADLVVLKENTAQVVVVDGYRANSKVAPLY